MPNGDGTGPMGNKGRGKGQCSNNQNTINQKNERCQQGGVFSWFSNSSNNRQKNKQGQR